MLRTVRLVVLLSVSALLLSSSSLVSAQSAPIPTQILTAKTAFVSNGGSTSAALSSADLYSGLYGALRTWGKFQLVTTPSEADLIFVVTYAEIPSDVTDGTSFLKPQLTLTVLDPKTHIALWTVTDYERPYAKKVEHPYDHLIAQVRILAEAKHSDAPAPAAAAKEAPKADDKDAKDKKERKKISIF
jgi:hypothetical protein